MNKYDEIKELIKKVEYGVDFADFGNGVSEDWISKAEERLGFRLPPSYKWWLKNYGGGEIYGEEIFSIYEEDFDTVVGGDIVYMYELNNIKGNYTPSMLVISEYDDEVFYFDLTNKGENNEYPINSLNSKSIYANDFIEFLKKRIEEN